jgi:excisionase family DNA binding protein
MQKSSVSFDSAAILVRAKEIASFLGCSPKHVRKLSERGEFPKPVKAGRLLRWSRQSVERWLAEQT